MAFELEPNFVDGLKPRWDEKRMASDVRYFESMQVEPERRKSDLKWLLTGFDWAMGEFPIDLVWDSKAALDADVMTLASKAREDVGRLGASVHFQSLIGQKAGGRNGA